MQNKRVNFGPDFLKTFNKYHKKDPEISSAYQEFVNAVTSGKPIPAFFRDHPLDPPMPEYMRECHLSSDILLIYYIHLGDLWVSFVTDHEGIKRGSKSEKDLANRMSKQHITRNN